MRNRTRVALVAALAVTACPAVWAEDQSGAYSSSSSSQAVPANSFSQGPTGAGSSGNIIGYKPIPSSALETAMGQQTGPAPAQAVNAYPNVGVQANSYAAMPQGVAAPVNGAPGPGLPVTYLTGIVGEGFYTLGRDDVIRIDVQGQPEFSGTFVVGFDGRLQYNYLGDLPIAGLTKYEVAQVLEKLLQRYVRTPVVSVMIVGYNSKVVYVIGEVNNPGKFIMRGDAIKLREALLAAGMPNDRAALSRVHVIKPDLENPTVRVINVKRILYKGKLKDDVDLASGEIVVLPSTIMSSVNRFLSGLLSPVTRAARFAALAAL
jgi:polysaccharide biosynthesis/export protein